MPGVPAQQPQRRSPRGRQTTTAKGNVAFAPSQSRSKVRGLQRHTGPAHDLKGAFRDTSPPSKPAQGLADRRKAEQGASPADKEHRAYSLNQAGSSSASSRNKGQSRQVSAMSAVQMPSSRSKSSPSQKGLPDTGVSESKPRFLAPGQPTPTNGNGGRAAQPKTGGPQSSNGKREEHGDLGRSAAEGSKLKNWFGGSE